MPGPKLISVCSCSTVLVSYASLYSNSPPSVTKTPHVAQFKTTLCLLVVIPRNEKNSQNIKSRITILLTCIKFPNKIKLTPTTPVNDNLSLANQATLTSSEVMDDR